MPPSSFLWTSLSAWRSHGVPARIVARQLLDARSQLASEGTQRREGGVDLRQIALRLLDGGGELGERVLEAPRLGGERAGRDREVRDEVAELALAAGELLEDARARLDQAAQVTGLLAEQRLAHL